MSDRFVVQLGTLSCAILISCGGEASPPVENEIEEDLIAVEISASEPMQCADPDPDGVAYARSGEGTDWAAPFWSEEGESEPVGGSGAAIEDFDEDGHLDIFLPTFGQDQIFMGDGTGVFRNETAARLPVEDEVGVGTAAADADGDGDVDIFVAVGLGADYMLWNNGDGTFTQKALIEPMRLAPRVASVGGSWGDMDGDGDLDLFVRSQSLDQSVWEQVTYCGCTGRADSNLIYRNDGDQTFTDLSWTLSDDARYGLTFASGWYDLDDDGGPELYIVNDFGMWGYPNVVARFDSCGMTNVMERTGLEIPLYGMGLGIGDLDGDEKLDFIVSGWDEVVPLEGYQGSWYRNDVGLGLRLEDAELDYSLSGFSCIDEKNGEPFGSCGRHTAWGNELVDLDNDRDLDLVIAFGTVDDIFEAYSSCVGIGWGDGQPDAVYLRDDNGVFSDHWAAERWGMNDTGIGRGVILGDLNEDGFQDIVKRPNEESPKLYLSRCGSNNWLIIRLRNLRPNTNAVGARIELTVNGQTLIRWIGSGSTGYASSNALEAHFGLGNADAVESIRIVWPDGSVSRIAGAAIGVNTRLLITRVDADEWDPRYQAGAPTCDEDRGAAASSADWEDVCADCSTPVPSDETPSSSGDVCDDMNDKIRY